MSQRFAALVEALFSRLTEEPATLAPELRRAIVARAAGDSDGTELPPALAAWVDTVARHAPRTTDEQVAAMRAAGLGEDAIFEATLCASSGAARARLDRGLAIIRGGR
jgi:alkylhydroperoxidase family enzyme